MKLNGLLQNFSALVKKKPWLGSKEPNQGQKQGGKEIVSLQH